MHRNRGKENEMAKTFAGHIPLSSDVITLKDRFTELKEELERQGKRLERAQRKYRWQNAVRCGKGR